MMRESLRFAASCVLVLAAAAVPASAQTQLATGKPTAFKVNVTKVELYNGTSFVTVFTGSAQLDLVAAAGGAFPGIADLSLPAGTYTQIRLTFANQFGMQGTLSSSGTTYYVTPTTINSNAAAVASTLPSAAGEATILNPSWGALGAAVTQTITISPVTVISTTTYQPTVKFDITSGLVLWTQAGTFYFTLAPITVTIV